VQIKSTAIDLYSDAADESSVLWGRYHRAMAKPPQCFSNAVANPLLF
jgi:hypothetical protein